jgi:2'-5' RNA ligase
VIGETAIAILVPDADPVVGPWRARFDADSVSAGVPAHITLLYPFRAPEEIDEAELDRLRSFFATIPPIDVALGGICGFPGVLYLAPEPSAPLDALLAALAARYPDTPPYGGLILDPIPHLTIAKGEAAEILEFLAGASARAHATGDLPIRTRIASVALMECDDDDRWRIHASFPLASG